MLSRELTESMHDTEFMTSKEKAQVLKQWDSFLRGLLEPDEGSVPTDYGGVLPKKKFGRFTKALYHHLSQHCEFIAHYDRAGFFAEYFLNPEDTIRFLGQFDADTGFTSVEYGMDLWVKDSHYADVNRAMCDILAPLKADLYARLEAQAKANDLAKAQALLAKHGLTIQA